MKKKALTFEPDEKRLRLVEDSSLSGGFPKFLKHVMFLENLDLFRFIQPDLSFSLQDSLIELGIPINNQPGEPDLVLFRECYRSGLKKILNWIEGRLSVFIGGAKGIGKSVFSVLLTRVLFQLGYVVVLERYSKRYLMIKETKTFFIWFKR